MLIKIYVSIIISIVLSPLALMLGALPGNNAFRSWLRVLVANLAVFPTILVILIISFVLLGASPDGTGQYGYNTSEESSGFIPPFLPGRGSSKAITVVLALGMILIMPDLALQVKKSIGGSGGIFEQFANNFTSALDKGVKGGPLIPGVGASDLGISARNIPRALFGNEKSQKAAQDGKGILGNGLIGGAWNQYKKTKRVRIENAIANKQMPGQDAPEVPNPLSVIAPPVPDPSHSTGHGGHDGHGPVAPPDPSQQTARGTALSLGQIKKQNQDKSGSGH